MGGSGRGSGSSDAPFFAHCTLIKQHSLYHTTNIMRY